jgi:hypothetical protein
MIKILRTLVEKVGSVQEQIGNVSRKMELLGRDQKEGLR